jgi:hypothetical protein
MKPVNAFPNGQTYAPQTTNPGQASSVLLSEVGKTEPPRGTSPDPAPASKEGHDSRGRFPRHNKGGPGNPFARQTAALRQALLDAMTGEDIHAMVRQLIQKACDGDVSAIRLALAYGIGKPDKTVDPDTLDAQEFKLWQQNAVPKEDFQGILGQAQATLANLIVRAALPAIQDHIAKDLAQQLNPPPQPPPAAPNPPAEPAPANSEPVPTPAESKKRAGEKAKDRPRPAVPPGPPVPNPDQLLQDIFQPGVTLEQEWQQWLEMVQRVNEPQPDDSPPDEGPDADDS